MAGSRRACAVGRDEGAGPARRPGAHAQTPEVKPRASEGGSADRDRACAVGRRGAGRVRACAEAGNEAEGGVRAEVRAGAAHAQWRGELFWGFYEY